MAKTMNPPVTGSSKIYGPWIAPEKLEAIPALRREFDLNRDPLFAKQLADLDKTEAERRRENAKASSGERGEDGRGAAAQAKVANPKPALKIKPPAALRAPVDRAHHYQQLAVERREAFLRQRSR